MMKAGDLVRMSDIFKHQLSFNGSCQHVEEFGKCIGVVIGPANLGGKPGPEVDVKWRPSNLRYAYHPDNLVKVK